MGREVDWADRDGKHGRAQSGEKRSDWMDGGCGFVKKWREAGQRPMTESERGLEGGQLRRVLEERGGTREQREKVMETED